MNRPFHRTHLVSILLALTSFSGSLAAQTTSGVSSSAGNYSHSFWPSVSADGRYTVYHSTGAQDPLDGCIDILLYDADLDSTVNLTGCDSQATAGGHSSLNPDISADASLVVFQRTMFLPPFPTTTQIVSRPAGGGAEAVVSRSDDSLGADPADGTCSHARLSEDGRHVVFETFADNLTTDVYPFAITQIMVRDRIAGTTTLISKALGLAQGGNGPSRWADISADGRFVVFESEATDLIAPGLDANNSVDVYVRDRDPDGNGTFDEGNGETFLVSQTATGVQGNFHSSTPAISGGGRFIAFASTANNLIPGDGNGSTDVIVADRDPDANGDFTDVPANLELVSVDSLGVQANGSSLWPSISEAGRFVAFSSIASDLVLNDSPPPTPNHRDVFVHDRQTGQTHKASVDSDGTHGNSESAFWNGKVDIAADGSRVVFESIADNLVSGDGNGLQDIFAHSICPTPGTDLGYGLAGWQNQTPHLTKCGVFSPLTSGTLRLTHARPAALSVLVLSLTSSPTPFKGGTLVPIPPSMIVGFITDSSGRLLLPGSGTGPADVHAQWIISDADGPAGAALSNAIRFEVLP